jgi:hypothetical protein
LSAIDAEISGLDVVEGSAQSYVQAVFGEPGPAVVIDDEAALVAVIGWHGDVSGACRWAIRRARG